MTLYQRIFVERVNLEKDVFIPKGNLGILRKDMPQIRSFHLQEFLGWLKDQGVGVKADVFKVNTLKPTQKEIDSGKVKKMYTAPDDVLKKPVIVSKDNHILDGHHRWLALLNKNENDTLKGQRINLNIRDLLKMAFKFPKVEKAGIKHTFAPKGEDLDLSRAALSLI